MRVGNDRMNKKQGHTIKANDGATIVAMLKRHGRLRVIPLGIFSVRKISGRVRHDFKSGKMKKQQPSKIVIFKPSKPLKDFIKGKRKRI